ncbi:MAG: response regulator [Verrucomicrobia bacterium]|nr:response regulator [Verrucomicrobiota bacterium]MCH8527629.1 response regulator [Kiritimatiellia bacterium]
MNEFSYSHPDIAALRGNDWSRVRFAEEVEPDAAAQALAALHAPEEEPAFWRAVGVHLEEAGELAPFAFELVWGEGEPIALEAVRLPSERDEARTFLLRGAGEQQKAIRALARAQALIELSYEGFTIFDAQATILYESATNERITGYPAEACVGRSLFEFIHPEDAGRLIPRFARLAGLPGELDADVVRWRHRDGHWIYLEGTVVNQLQDPQIRGMINTFHDVTARVEMERALTEAKEAAEALQTRQQRFMAMLSHELRTPLSLIKQPLEALIPAQKADPQWDMVQRGLRRLELLIEELVDFTLLDAGEARLRVREVMAGDFLRELVAEMRPLAEARRMTLVFDPVDPSLRVYLDTTKFAKVIFNLIGNAVKFAPEGSGIGIRCRRAGGEAPGELEIEIEDAGRPIPGEVRARMFERFFQGESGDDRGWEGMGLGLSLAAEIVALHGGEIGLLPDPGGGAGNCFRIRVPLGADHIALEDLAIEPASQGSAPEDPPRPMPVFQADTSCADSPGDPQRTASEPGRTSEIMIIEDHPDLQRFLARQLEEVYALRFARNGEEALPVILNHPPDLILSDVMMPGLDGIALCQKIRDHFSARELPILLLSAKGRPEDRLIGLQAGANDYLSKPFSMDELRLRIHNHLCVRRTAAPQPAAWPEQVRAVISDRMGTGPFGAVELADALGMSQRQLQRRCTESFGQTPGQLIQEIRLRRARLLLESGEVDSVAAAARAVGVSASYLSRRFRAVFNQVPKEFLAAQVLPEITEP